MEQKISNPIPVHALEHEHAAATKALPQHIVTLSTPRKTVERRPSVADMLVRLTTSTAASRNKMRDSHETTSPERRIKSSQSMLTLKQGISSPLVGSRRHNRTASNPGMMPAISRPIAVPVGSPQMSRIRSDGHSHTAASRPMDSRSRESSSPSLMSDSSSGSNNSSTHLASPASSVRVGMPRRPAPLPPSQATSSQPRTKRGTNITPPHVRQGPGTRARSAASKAGGKSPVDSRLRTPDSGDDSLQVKKVRRTPKKANEGSPQYVKRSPQLPRSRENEAVGLGLDLGADSVRKRVKSAPAPPSGYSATTPRSMSHVTQRAPESHVPLREQQSQLQEPQSQPQKQQHLPRQQWPPAQFASQPRQPPQTVIMNGQRSASGPSASNLRPQPRSPLIPGQKSQPQPGQRFLSRQQQMRERVAELQSITRANPARTKQQPGPPQHEFRTPELKTQEFRSPGPRTPDLRRTPEADTYKINQAGFGSLPGPAVAPLNTLRTGSHGMPKDRDGQKQEGDLLRQKLSRLEIRYNVLKEQRALDAESIQNVNAELSVVSASRDRLEQQVKAYEQAHQDLKRRYGLLQRNLTRTQRVVRVLEANLEESKVALEEKHIENYSLKRAVLRATPKNSSPGGHAYDTIMLSPPHSISDAGDIDRDADHDSDTPTIKG